VLGLGVLGGAVAQALAEFGFAVSGWSRSPRSMAPVRCEHGADGLDAVLERSQLLMLFLPLTSETESLMDDARLAQLPDGAALLNLARGELIDDDALLAALDADRLAEAYLDVFRDEPLPAEHRFWHHPRIQVTPHVAALTDVPLACAQIAAKIRRLEAGEAISGVVDRSRGY
jgi:glyoxylate/hydroxypyruvate reductase A